MMKTFCVSVKTVAAVIPAWNEEQTIGPVVEVLRTCLRVQELIVVSDGSTDHTAEVARRAGATVFELKPNRGKGQALLFGIQQARADVLFFLDADLLGLTQAHVEQILTPVLNGSLFMNVGIRDRGRFITALCHFLPLVSGERAVRREVIEGIPETFFHGFMLEPAMNHFCRSHGLPYGKVDTLGLTIRRKYQKVPLLEAVVQYVAMIAQIAWAMIRVRFTNLIGTF
jgi:glycosyltransferase involved in cell wall biosynthesis